jgi:hypothetical protein
MRTTLIFSRAGTTSTGYIPIFNGALTLCFRFNSSPWSSDTESGKEGTCPAGGGSRKHANTESFE